MGKKKREESYGSLRYRNSELDMHSVADENGGGNSIGRKEDT